MKVGGRSEEVGVRSQDFRIVLHVYTHTRGILYSAYIFVRLASIVFDRLLRRRGEPAVVIVWLFPDRRNAFDLDIIRPQLALREDGLNRVIHALGRILIALQQLLHHHAHLGSGVIALFPINGFILPERVGQFPL